MVNRRPVSKAQAAATARHVQRTGKIIGGIVAGFVFLALLQLVVILIVVALWHDPYRK